MPGWWVQLCRPLEPLLPGVEAPVKSPKAREKIGYVLGVLIFYLVASKTPLYGIRASGTADPLSFYRVMLASNRGTLMELGISPIVTSSMIVQACVGANLISFDRNNKEDARMYEVMEKLSGIVMILGQSIFYTVFSGVYGNIYDLGLGNAGLIVVQLCVSALFVLLLDDLLKAGYGFGSAISLFISVNICESIFWQAFSYRVVDTIVGPEYEGAIVNLVFSLIAGQSVRTLKHAFFRSSLPNVSNLLATLVVFVVVIYFQGFRVDIPIKHARGRNRSAAQQTYAIRLFYTSNVPIMLQSTLTSTVFMVSSLIYSRLGSNMVTKFLGRWMNVNGRSIPVGGLCYYLSAPQSIVEVLRDPIHFIFYVFFMLASCSVLAYMWLEMSGSSPRDVSESLKKQGMVVLGYRPETMINAFNRYIPTAASFGGLCVGALTIFADLLGALGSGTGILLAVGNILQLVETFHKDIEKEMSEGSNGVMAFRSIFSS